MPTVRGTPGRADSPLRRVAIVVSVLPEPAADRLLGGLNPALRNRIRETAKSLGEVEPWERQLALRSFAGSLRDAGSARPVGLSPASGPHAGGRAGEIADEARFGQASQPPVTVDPATPPAPAATPPKPESPLAFLRDVSAETLVERLTGEHPQTVALVLASISPELAAAVLAKLPDDERQAAIGRLGRLDEIPDDAIAAIADHLRERLGNATAPAARSAGQRALAAIFAQLRPAPGSAPTDGHATPESSFPGSDATGDPVWPPRPFPERPSRPRASGSHATAPGTTAPGGWGWGAMAPGASGWGLTGSDLDGPDAPIPGGWGGRPGEGEPIADDAAAAFSQQQAHEHLVTLDPAQLCQALGQVDTRQALLTLCGIPADVADAVLDLLPRRQAKDVRRQLASLGSIRLREIDAAKMLVARVSLGGLEAESPTPEPLAA